MSREASPGKPMSQELVAAAETPPNAAATYDRFAMERVILFSDAVYAIIITLLALDVRLPEHAEGVPVAKQLLLTLPKIASYALSFIVVANLWRIHLRRFRYVVAIDATLISGNIVQLMLTGLLPFSTAVLNSRLGAAAVTLYAGNIVAVTVAAWLTWRHARVRPGLVSPELGADVCRDDDRRTAVTIGVFVASMALAWWNPLAAVLGWLSMVPLNRMLDRARRRQHRGLAPP